MLYNISYSTTKPSLIYDVIYCIKHNTPFDIFDTIVWKKSNALPNNMSKNRLTRTWEYIFVFARKEEAKTFYMNKDVLSVRSNGIKQYSCIDNIIFAKNNDGSCKLNKATYSSELCEQLLDIYMPDNAHVYDPFNGTGTTGIACLRKNAQWYFGSELSAEQCKYSVDRIEKEILDNPTNI